MSGERTLVTGFGDFGTVTGNPSAVLAKACGRPYDVIEVAYRAADDFLSGLEAGSFDRLLMLGVAAGRDRLALELFARNMIGRARDVRGNAPEGYIEEGAPLLLESTLWTPEIASEIVAYDPRTRMSWDAGTYLCNYLAYRALQRFPGKALGFLHVPGIERMPLDQQQEALRRILEVIEQGTVDQPISAVATSAAVGIPVAAR